MSGLTRAEDPTETSPQASMLEMVLPDCGEPFSTEFEIPSRAAGVGLLEPRSDEPFLLQAAQRDEDGRLGNRSAAVLLQREDERHAVRLTAPAKHRQQDLELEVLKHLSAHSPSPIRLTGFDSQHFD
jgi:hypothetical protein